MGKHEPKRTVVAPPSALYRRIAFSFIGAAVVLLIVVSYYSLARVTIIVKPKAEALSASLAIDMSSAPDEHTVRGAILTTVGEAARAFPASDDEGTVTEVPATGRVIIRNTTDNNQPLVRTTRLLAPDGKLFRLSETVTVPAGGSVDVAVYADAPGAAGEIQPTRFTIPGLWQGLHDKIYAESTAAFCCGAKTVRMLTDEDLKAAAQTLEADILAQLRESFRTDPATRGLAGEVLLPEILERTSDTEPGAEATEFTIGMKLKVTGIFYDKAAVLARATEVLRGLAGPEGALVEVDPERMSVVVERYSAETSEARLAVDAVGLLALRPESAMFAKDRLVGLDRAALESYFDAWQSIESVRIEFRPSWMRRVPRLKDHIEIQIQE